MRTAALLAAVSSLAFLASVSAETAENPHAAEAKAIVKEFAMTLKGELQSAIQAGGPVSAIAVCKDRAPAIAQALSEKSGWEVGRTSLKLRNPALNTPDEWESAVLLRFEERKAAGEDVEAMAFAAVVETDAGKRFRFMKAVPTADLCLACHGESIGREIAAAIDQSYPDDKARGFKAGDIRGAFTLSKPL